MLKVFQAAEPSPVVAVRLDAPVINLLLQSLDLGLEAGVLGTQLAVSVS
jgi:hypothetical protein